MLFLPNLVFLNRSALFLEVALARELVQSLFVLSTVFFSS